MVRGGLRANHMFGRESTRFGKGNDLIVGASARRRAGRDSGLDVVACHAAVGATRVNRVNVEVVCLKQSAQYGRERRCCWTLPARRNEREYIVSREAAPGSRRGHVT